jgi:hypothetical protein
MLIMSGQPKVTKKVPAPHLIMKTALEPNHRPRELLATARTESVQDSAVASGKTP